ncbi:MAG: DUF3341 domain-containing protein [Leptospiraceae bacterium]|nr:DUF3341 domain-containing protein [Leptospiraceae bacterium]MCB1199348.1 DUF3341 domain-containing protein [Leptospiraceae bacterium]
MPSLHEIKEGLFSYQESEKGWVATVRTPADLLAAAKKVREAGIQNWDCYSPCPIHGMDEAMGLHRSWIPFITLVFALLGATLGISYISYIDLIDWSIVYAGKPYFSWPAYIPILFELSVFFGGTATVAAVLILGKLGKISRKPINNRITSDGFAVWIGDSVSREKVQEILGNLAEEVSAVE